MHNSKRRDFLVSLGATASVVASKESGAQSLFNQSDLPLSILPTSDVANIENDLSYWLAVKKLYAVTTKVTNLENGYWGVMTEQVRLQFERNIERLNQENSHYARINFASAAEAARSEVASSIGALPQEIAFTRGATEAMQLLIGGFNALKPGDSVIYADLDYDSMQYSMKWLAKRRGVNVIKLNIPEPANKSNILLAYQRILQENPTTKLLLLTHVSHRTGLVMPVKEIADMARKLGVSVVLDAAHSWGQIDFKINDLGVDFAGFNLHKWIGAPLGVGFLYIKKERLSEIDTAMGDEDWPMSDIRSRVHSGTTNFATLLTVPKALAVHQQIGPKAKEKRLKYLRNYWVNQVQSQGSIEILTPNEPDMVAGITSFRIKGKVSAAENNTLVVELLNKYGLFTVRRGGVFKGDCVRVSPALYNDESDLDRLVLALKNIVSTQ
jgi:selenocysteine lyase/cysteine desulfurase